MRNDSDQDGYDIAQVCLNGHEANATSQRSPEFNKPHCDICGEETITKCPACNTPIRGYYWGSLSVQPYVAPRHCYQCGKPFPWTERKQAAALELFAEELAMDKEQQEELKRDLKAASSEEPRAQAASLKIKRLLGKVKKDAANIFHDVLVDVLSETAKKVIWPGK